jgi:hypothetical protein
MIFFAGLFAITYIILHYALYVWGIAVALKILSVMPIAVYTWPSIIGTGFLIFIGAIISNFLMKAFSE